MTSGDSRRVTSAQAAAHPRVAAIVARHLATPWQAPRAAHLDAMVSALASVVAIGQAPLVLDSGCGTGESTRALATMHRDALVLGVDQSRVRLRGVLGADDALAARDGNAAWLRGDVAQLWRFLAAQGVTLTAHYLLYPNPWPKASQLRRRWHAHPAFVELLRLGGVLELRCNWRVYADEFVAALAVAGVHATVEPLPDDGDVLSPFERKYRASGHARWRVRADLRDARVTAALPRS